MRYTWIIWVFSILLPLFCPAQADQFPFRIRTITVGINLDDLSDLKSLKEGIDFLYRARGAYEERGYTVQTIRIATQHFYQYLQGRSYAESLSLLQQMDAVAKEANVMIAIGEVLPPNVDSSAVYDWVAELVRRTSNINFSLSIASHQKGVHRQSIQTASAIIARLATIGEGGEANFRFAATAACPPGIPFFPAAYHQGPQGFALGIESPGILMEVFMRTKPEEARYYLKDALERYYEPLEAIGRSLADSTDFRYNGLDVSTAPGLDASIGEAIETHSGRPFGAPSTLHTCAMITDVLKHLNLKLCGFSGLMLPVIEDKVLAARADEGTYSVQELLLFSAVSGTGLDVVPLPGDTHPEEIAGLLADVAALSLKYTAKPLSARLFLLPGKKAGDRVTFKNPYLTGVNVMSLR